MRFTWPTVRVGDRWTLFSALAIFCVSVPGLASYKALLLLAYWACLLCTSTIRPVSIVWFLSVLLQLAFLYETAYVHEVNPYDTSNQGTRTFLFFVILSLGLFAKRSSMVTQARLDHAIAWMASITAFTKITVLALVATGVASLERVEGVVGFESVSDNIGFGLQRLQFPSDIVLIFLVVGYVGGRRKWVDLVVLLAITASILLSFSRFLFASYVVCLIVRALLIRNFDLISRASLLIGAALAAIFSVALINRFGGAGTSFSDWTRTEQMTHLGTAIMERPIFGLGMGASLHDYKRTLAMPFSYEVQWYALAMQFGFFGIGWFLLNLLLPLTSQLKGNSSKLLFFVVLTLWVA